MQVKKDDVEARIIAGATELFVRDGFEGTSVSSIVSHAGVGKGTVYTYFDSKDALLEAAVAAVFAELGSIVEHAAEDNDEVTGFARDLVSTFFGEIVNKLRIIMVYHRKEAGRRSVYASLARPFADAMAEAHRKYLAGGPLGERETYATVSALMVSSFIVHESMGVEVARSVMERILVSLFRGSEGHSA